MLLPLFLAASVAVEEPAIHPTWLWLGMQLLPSPELSVGDRAGFGLRWQLTPVLYSFGIHRALSPWRFFVVEPLTRQSGSIELHVSPEYLAVLDQRFGGRIGVRSYFPLLQRGDNLSLSLGSSYVRYGSRSAAAYEAGLYVLSGFFGLEIMVAPALEAAPLVFALKVRAF